MARSATAKRPVRVEDEQGYAPTPETVRKRRADVLIVLFRREVIDAQQLDAAVQIRAGVEALTSDVRMRTAERQHAGRPPRRMTAPSILRSLDLPVVRGYLAWADAMQAKRMAIGPVLDVVVDGLSLRDVQARRGISRDGLADALPKALDLYDEA